MSRNRSTEDEQLLLNSDVEDENEDLEKNVLHNHKYLSPHTSVIGIIGLLCIFILIISTVFFAVLYYKLIRNDSSKLPDFPAPSNSLLGEYSTAAVAADNEICSEIGRDILLKGGNAVDAAIATLFCIGVMDTQSSGLGGGHFMTIYNATTKRCHVVDARETAPLAASENMYKDRWNKSKYGWEAVAIPGELHGLWTEKEAFGGDITWSELIQPTIRLLKEGYPTSHALAKALQDNEKKIEEEATMRPYFINPQTNKIFKLGEQIRTRGNLIETLNILAKASNPVEEFYRGNLTKKMVEEFQKNKGLITLEDFDRYSSIIRKEEEIIYTRMNNGRSICGPPPPSGSAVAQAILNILDGIPMDLTTFEGNTNWVHNFIEASKFAYAQRSALGDMNFILNASDIARNITDRKWADHIRTLITERTHPDNYYGGDFQAAPEDHGTAHISIVDKHGNAVSVTSTINLLMGALVVSESTGILWNDEMDDFSTPGHPNYFGIPPSPANFIRPGKRPQSSMSPIIIYNSRNDKEVMSVGAAGGSTIISGVAGVALRTLWFNENVKESIDAPRLHNQLRPNSTYYENNFPKPYIEALRARGHNLTGIPTITVVTAVERRANGSVFANSDYRKGPESEPAGY